MSDGHHTVMFSNQGNTDFTENKYFSTNHMGVRK
jgi:hypothetical protein